MQATAWKWAYMQSHALSIFILRQIKLSQERCVHSLALEKVRVGGIQNMAYLLIKNHKKDYWKKKCQVQI